MLSVGYTKIVNLCCGAHPLDNIYVRNDFQSSTFVEDGGDRSPKLLGNVMVRTLTKTRKKYIKLFN